jgi:hypothetical protein
VLLDTETGTALRLNPSAAWLWEQLQEPARVSDLATALAERFGIDDERALGDTLAVLSELASRGLLLDIGE